MSSAASSALVRELRQEYEDNEDDEEEEQWRREGPGRRLRCTPLLSASDQEFERKVQRLEVYELLQLITCLQDEMKMEQMRFDELNTLLQHYRKYGAASDKPKGPRDVRSLSYLVEQRAADGDEDETDILSASLCRSQIRLAQLCNRNMRCFTQQAARSQDNRSGIVQSGATYGSSSSSSSPDYDRHTRNGESDRHQYATYVHKSPNQNGQATTTTTSTTRESAIRKLQGGASVGIPCPATGRAVDPSPPPPTYPSPSAHQYRSRAHTAPSPQPYRSASNHSTFPPKYSPSHAAPTTTTNNNNNRNNYGYSPQNHRDTGRQRSPPPYSEEDPARHRMQSPSTQQQQVNAVPSVHDILRNVRSLCKNGLETTRPEYDDYDDEDEDDRASSSGLVARLLRDDGVGQREAASGATAPTMTNGDSVAPPAPVVGNEYDLVPTATQLLLRRSQAQTNIAKVGGAPDPGKPGSHGYHEEEDEESDDAISSYYDDANDVRSGIRRSNFSCPQLASSDEYVTGEDLLHSLSRPESAEPGSLLADTTIERDNDDGDSGVGTEEHPGPTTRIQMGTNRKRHQRRLLADVNYYSPSTVSLTPTMVAPPESNDKEPPTNGHHPTTTSNNSPMMVNTFGSGHNNNNDDIDDTIVRSTVMSLELQPPAPSKVVPITAVDEDENYVVPSIIDQFAMTPNTENEIFRRQKGTGVDWNPMRLLEELYAIPQPEAPMQPPAAYINMEGYLEKLPSGRRQATFWNAWKRRYFQLKDGFLYCYQSAKSEQPSAVLQLMGGKIDTVETTLLGIDDGKGHYVVVRCANRLDTERWRRALITHTAENYALIYAQPVRAYPQFYEDVLIIDVGSCSMRAGILCNQPTLPQVYFPTVCAKDKVTGRTVYGKEALKPKTRLGATISFPLRPSAKITKFTVDMDAVKGLLTKVFSELNVDPSDYQIQLSLPRSFPFRSQTDVLNLLMTEFGVKAVNLTAQTVLALCSYNASSGVVVDIGERMEVVPIVDGYVIEAGVTRIPYGGSRLMDHLRHFLMQRHYGLVSETESFLLRHVLEKACYCAEYYKGELHRFHEDPQSFETAVTIGRFFDDDDSPWQAITLDVGRFQAPEGLFNPDAWGLDNPGVHKLVAKAIQECSLDVRKEICKSIYLSGGVTMLPGFADRLQMEMTRLTPPSVTPKVHASPYRNHAAYLGACVWASSAGFRQAKITRDEWIANGSACLKKWHF